MDDILQPGSVNRQGDFERGNDQSPAEIPDREQVQAILQRLRERPLSERHVVELRASGLSDETIRGAGLCSATADESQRLGFYASPALVFPYLQHAGYVRIKPDQPRTDAKGRAIKYETLRGEANYLFMPPRTRSSLMGMTGATVTDIIITEGEKKALKADQEGFTAISVPGVWGWCKGALRELNQIDWRGKRVYIVFDSDVTTKVDVKEAISALAEHLRKADADIRVVRLPDVAGCAKTGLDDFLVAHGRDALQRLLSGAGDWLTTLLGMIEPNWSADRLEVELPPIYRWIKRSGTVAQRNMIEQLRVRLRACHYLVPPIDELKRAIRDTPSYVPEGSVSSPPSGNTSPAVRFVAEGRTGDFANQPELQGFYDHQPKEPRQLTNFTLFIEEDVTVDDDVQPHRRFAGHIELRGSEYPFSINAADFANNSKLTAAIFDAAGPKAEIRCTPEILRTAISAVSAPEARRVSANFGWNAERDVYLVPGGRITASGYQQATDGDEQIELASSEFARRLGLHTLAAEQLAAVKRHVVTDLLNLCPDRRVGLCLLAAVVLSVLYPFTDGFNRAALWIVGLSGSGKSFLAKLFQNFFGNFPLAGENSTISWLSTANRIQLEGYYFRGALYLVDDYKPEHCKPWEATRVLQAYADSAARSRLRRDATAAASREIRGLLLCTGEDVPDHSASASARLIKIPYPSAEKDLERGQRCREQRRHYPGITADFIRHCLAAGRPEAFVERVNALQLQYYNRVAGRYNDVRIAGNFAQLGAAFEEIASYLADVWPECASIRERFIEHDLPAMMQMMLTDVSEQKASRIFLSTLAMLIRQGAVRIEGRPSNISTAKLIGRALPGEGRSDGASGHRTAPSVVADVTYEIWTRAALAEVQTSLRQQGRPSLEVTEKALLRQLREDGVLLDANNNPIRAEGAAAITRQVCIDEQNHNGFRIRQAVLTEGWQ